MSVICGLLTTATVIVPVTLLAPPLGAELPGAPDPALDPAPDTAGEEPPLEDDDEHAARPTAATATVVTTSRLERPDHRACKGASSIEPNRILI
jgi:hypothetical protein